MVSPRRAVAHTAIGHVRSINEDAVLDLGRQGLWAVADGMGGHRNGDYASQCVVQALQSYRASRFRGQAMSRLHTILARCNTHLVSKAAADNAGIIGCTVAVLTQHGSNIVCSWSGDSRIYRLRQGQLSLLTRDHNYGSLAEDRDRFRHPREPMVDASLLTAAIGGSDEIMLERSWYALQSQDQFLVCTDGLYKELSDERIASVLRQDKPLEERLATLVSQYEQAGATDNIGMVLVGMSP